MTKTLDSNLSTLLQAQMNREVVAMLTYKQFRDDLRFGSWDGFHEYFHAEEDEEHGHVRDISHFLDERQVRPIYSSIQLAAIPYSADKPINYFKLALTLEEEFWDNFDKIYEEAESADDPDVCKFVYKFIKIQHDSVDELTYIIQKLTRAGNEIAALEMIDKEVNKISKK